MGKFTLEKTLNIALYFRRKSIQNMLLVYLTAVAVIGIFLMVIPIYLNFTRTVEEMIKEKNIQVIDETNRYLDSNLKSIMKISDTIYHHVIKNNDLEKISIEDEIKLLAEVNKEQIVDIILFNSLGKIEEADTKKSLKENIDTRRNRWFDKAINETGEIHFSTPHVQNLFNNLYGYNWVVSLSRGVDIEKGGNVEKGVLLIDMNFSGIEKVCRDANLGSDGYVYLVSKEGELIYHPRQQLIYSGLEDENTKWVIEKEDGSYLQEFQGKEQLITIKTATYTGWKLVAVTPITEVIAQYSKIRWVIFISLVFVTFIIVYISLFVSSKIASPIKKLDKSVQELESGNLDAEISINGPFEISHLGFTVKSMALQMKKLMEDILIEQEAKRKSEINALQTQINPHFLYNTLDSIIWMIENQRYEGAIIMVTSLARLFRISLSKGENIITVKQELEHAKHYLTIQNIRYKNKFTYKVKGEDEVLGLKTLKLVVQPMIENAIYHGMTEDDDGEIIVSAYLKKDKLIIDIIDNGIGIPKEKVESILKNNKVKDSNKFGIGIKNVNERIRLTFGEKYGLRIISEPDYGTTIRLEMPIITSGNREGIREEILIEK